MSIISDSSPIIALASIDKLILLEKLYRTITIPEAILYEVFSVRNHAIQKKPAFIKVEEVKDKNLVRLLRIQYDFGESEVIALAVEKGIDRVIIDDKQARKTASQLGLKVIGTLGILIKAKEKQLINEVRPLILDLINKKISGSIRRW